ncbi:MAG: heparinase II/III-family protein [Opitutaceae bacterium]|nr:heparinase II/III-family protein [Opitutaceae bacterium]
MKWNVAPALAALFCGGLLSAAQNPPVPPKESPNLFSARWTPAELARQLVPLETWKPFPPASDRAAWGAVNPEIAARFIKFAEKHLSYKWPTVPATASMAFVRTGNRSGYESVSSQKREVLAALVVAELIEDKGRFVDQIGNGIWSICEETWWGSPAHLKNRAQNGGLHDVTEPFVDLFAAATAETLAWADYFAGEKLDRLSPLFRKRIAHEIQQRVLEPLMTKPHGWRGGGKSRPNNWNPWICSNWLAAALLIERDEGRRAAHVAKVLETLDFFVNPYPADGGCDEGPGYWNVAAGSLFDCVVLLNKATGNGFQYVFEDAKIKSMARYIVSATVNKHYVVNFADAQPNAKADGGMVWRFGRATGDPTLASFGAFFYKEPGPGSSRSHTARLYHSLLMDKEIRSAPARLTLARDVWLPDLQMAAARETADSDAGFYFAAKGGHNAESHNHNDIGNFIVFHNGLPLLIDVGAGRYTANTFGPNRYKTWNFTSAYHNTPSLNGEAQKAGRSYKATRAGFRAEAGRSAFTADIAGAYPKTAGVTHWRRTVMLERGSGVVVRDETRLTRTERVEEHLMTACPVEQAADGTVRLKAGGDVFVVRFEGAKAETRIEKVKLEGEADTGIFKTWGEVSRITFDVAKPRSDGVYTITVTRAP